MNPYNWLLQAQLLRSGMPRRVQQSTPYDPYNDDEETQRRARDAGRSALLAGMLNSYLSRGQGVGDAFTSMSKARQGVLDRAGEEQRQRAFDERQARTDAGAERARVAEIDNKRVDNEREQHAIEARVAEANAKRQAAEADQARTDALRAKLVKVNPHAADFTDEQVHAEYAKRYGYHEPDKPRAVAEHVDKPPTPAELRAERGEEQRQLKTRQDELYDEWLAGKSPADVWRLTEADKAKARIDARHRAAEESGGSSPSASTSQHHNEPMPASLKSLATSDAMRAHAQSLHDGGMSWSEIEAALRAKLGH